MTISTVLSVKVAHLVDGTECRVVDGKWQDKDGEIIEDEFVFDGASSPRFLWPIIPRFGDLEESCRHDWDCMHARIMMARGGKDNEARALALRKDADKRYGKGKRMRNNIIIGLIAYYGVRIGSFLGAGWEDKKYTLRKQ